VTRDCGPCGSGSRVRAASIGSIGVNLDSARSAGVNIVGIPAHSDSWINPRDCGSRINVKAVNGNLIASIIGVFAL
jgi:hypothetical protein